jgi:uncharacterized protein (TIGR02145 family)
MDPRLMPYAIRLLATGVFIWTLAGCDKEDPFGLPVLTTLPVTNISANMAKSGGDITDDGGAEITGRGLVWGTLQNPDIETHEGITAEGTGTGEFISTMTGLSPETTYYVRAFATNIAGTAYGNQLHFITGPYDPGEGMIADVENNTYRTVIIGKQVWMAENLKTTFYRNGTPIDYPNSDNMAWAGNTSGAYAWYDNDISNKNRYGALYNWYAINNPNGLCPSGWRVPRDEDWSQLIDYLVDNYEEININNVAEKLKSCRQAGAPMGGDCDTENHPRWDLHTAHYGTDDFGFSALPGGFRYSDGRYSNLGSYAGWWTSTRFVSSYAWSREMYHFTSQVRRYHDYAPNGFSVRCMQDLPD